MKNLAGKLEHAQLRERLKEKNVRIATFGMTEENFGQHLARFIKKSDIVVNFDNNRWGDSVSPGVETFLSGRIGDFVSKYDVLVIMSKSIDEISRQLDQMEVKQYFSGELINEKISDEILFAPEKEHAVVTPNIKYIDETRKNLADKRSVEVFDALLTARQSSETWERFHLTVSAYSGDEYFPLDIPSYSFTENEVFVDAGAYMGDTVEIFLKKTGSLYNHIYAFEPDTRNYARLETFCEGKPNITLYQAGLYSRDTTLEFLTHDTLSTSSTLRDTNNKNSQSFYTSAISSSMIEVHALDSVLDKPVSFIKMDIEGAEQDALLGAERSIVTHKPKLAICLYHKISDFWEIPLYLKKIAPAYQLYIRHHAIGTHCFQTVLYAVSN